MPRTRREGATLGEIVDNYPEFELENEADRALTSGSHTEVCLIHSCGDGKTHRFEMRVCDFARGSGCKPCGIKSRCEQRATPKNENASIFAFKIQLIIKLILLVTPDHVLKTINRGSRKFKVRCACLRNRAHPNWDASPNDLTQPNGNGTGCLTCRKEKAAAAAAIANSTPKSFAESLAAILDAIAARRPTGLDFLGLLDATDSRTAEQIKQMANAYGLWRCRGCGNVFSAYIYHVTRGTGCRLCSRPGCTEGIVLAFLREAFGDVLVIDQFPLGTYKVDARVFVSHLGVYGNVEIDGEQHYMRVTYTDMTLEQQIARDVEKMRRSVEALVPTVRIPTCVVARDARDDGEKWKAALLASIDSAAIAAAEAARLGVLNPDDAMIVVPGHASKYGAHDALLRTVLAGGMAVDFDDMHLVAESV
jgi:hypothetical protein